MSFGEYASVFGQLGGNFLAQQQEAEQRSALAKLGEQLQAGNYTDAVGTAFGGLHDPQTGLGLLKLLDTQQQRKLTAAADADFARGFGGFGVGGPVGAPGGGPNPSGGVPSFLDLSGPSGSYQANLFKRESNNNPNAQAGTSSAKGLGQFTTGTWNRVAKQNPDLGLTPVGPGTDGRSDPQQMIRATQALTAENEGLLQSAGLPVTDATRYALHFLGGGGGRRLVAGAMRNPDTPATMLASPDAVSANRNVFFNRDGSAKSAGQVLNDFARSFGGGRGAPQAPAPQVASVDPSFAPQMPGQPLQAPVQGLNPGRPQQAVPAPRPVQYADDEAQTQALERQMGMVPPQAATAPAPRPPQTLIPQSMAGSGIPGTVMDRGVPVAQIGAPDQANMPAPDAQPAQFRIPPGPRQAAPGSVASLPAGLSSPQPRGPLTAPAMPQQAAPALPISGSPSDYSPGRVMAMPGDVPAAAASPTDRAFSAQANTMAQSPLGQRIPMLMRAVANPNLSEGPRQIAQTMLKQALDETAMPPAVKEWQYARANGYTQARSPAEYAAEVAQQGKSAALDGEVNARAAAAQRFGMDPNSPEFRDYTLGYKPTRDPGQDLQAQIRAREAEGIRLGMQPGSAELQNYALGNRPAAERQTEAEKLQDAARARRQIVLDQGGNPDDPRTQTFIRTGKDPREEPFSATDKKAVMQAEDQALQLDQTIGTLSRAKELNTQTYTGTGAGILGRTGTSFPGASYILDPKKAEATREFNQIMSMEAIKAMSSTLKGATTDREMDRFVEILGDPATPPDIRGRTIERMMTLAQRQRDIAQSRYDELRGGSYFKPGGGASAGSAPQAASRGGPSGAPALPPPSPSNRPGAPTGSPPAVSAPPAAVDHLRQNPGLSAAFDAKYGPGSAAAVLGGR